MKVMFKKLKRKFSLEAFATTNVANQFTTLLAISSLVIIAFGFILKSFEISFLVFLSPANIIKLDGVVDTIIGSFELIIGLLFGSATISILTSFLFKLTEKIKNGYNYFHGSNHYVLINFNEKTSYYLQELNAKFCEINGYAEAVIVLESPNRINGAKGQIPNLTHVKTFFKVGEFNDANSLERISISSSTKVVIFQDEEISSNLAKDNNVIRHLRNIILNSKKTFRADQFIVEISGQFQAQAVVDGIYRDNDLISSIQVNPTAQIKRFLNRSLIKPVFYEIYTNLVTYDGKEIYAVESSKYFKGATTFLTAAVSMSNVALIGIVSPDGSLQLNPEYDVDVQGCELVLVADTEFSASVNSSIDEQYIETIASSPKRFSFEQPRLRERRKICVVGSERGISSADVSEFLDSESAKVFERISFNDNEKYFENEFIVELSNKDSDIFIFDLEDEVQFQLTIFLQKHFKDNHEFISKIINIFDDPVNASLLDGKGSGAGGVILSRKLVGQYMAQLTDGGAVIKAVFDELTSAYGNEVYLIDVPSVLRECERRDIVAFLLLSGMCYLGTVENGEVVFHNENYAIADSFIVITEGVDLIGP